MLLNPRQHPALPAGRPTRPLLALAAVIALFLPWLHARAMDETRITPQRFLRLDYAPAGLASAPPREPSPDPRVAKPVGGFNVVNPQDSSRLQISFAGPVRAEIRPEAGIPLVYVDILGGTIDADPLVIPFSRGPVRVARLVQISTLPPVVRATLFLRELTQPQLQVNGENLELVFPDIPTPPTIEPGDGPTPYSLLAPGPRPSVPALSPAIHLALKGADIPPLVQELAAQAGMALHFRDPFDEAIDLSLIATSPVEAIRGVIAKAGGIVSVEDGEIWLTRADNPLLAFKEDDLVEGADLRGLAIGDVLRALGQIAKLNIVLDRSVEPVRDRPLDSLFQKMSCRRAFETLLRVNGLTARRIDRTTLLIMSDAAARQAQGSIVRVIAVVSNISQIREMLKSSLSADLGSRLTVSEDLGNLVLIGDREAVFAAERQVHTLEGKLERAGEATRRVLFQPVNTAPAELIKLAGEALGEKTKPQMLIDARTDQIVINGPNREVERARNLLSDLDRPPTRQALVRIRVVEVSRTLLRKLGLRLETDNFGLTDLNRPPTQYVLPASFHGLDDDGHVKTLANPLLRCMDKQEATIKLTEQIPYKNPVVNYIPVGSSSLAAQTSENWTNADIGINLSIKPQIHADAETTLEVKVQLTELIRLVEGHPWTATRNLDTRVRVKSEETVVIGGLIRKKKTQTHKSFPIISRIPILRKLVQGIEFKQTDDEETEMVILITPVVVSSVARTEGRRGIPEASLPATAEFASPPLRVSTTDTTFDVRPLSVPIRITSPEPFPRGSERGVTFKPVSPAPAISPASQASPSIASVPRPSEKPAASNEIPAPNVAPLLLVKPLPKPAPTPMPAPAPTVPMPQRRELPKPTFAPAVSQKPAPVQVAAPAEPSPSALAAPSPLERGSVSSSSSLSQPAERSSKAYPRTGSPSPKQVHSPSKGHRAPIVVQEGPSDG